MTIKYITKSSIESLILFIEKIEELKASQFFDFYFNKIQQIHLRHEDSIRFK